jgi:hypothetical protein
MGIDKFRTRGIAQERWERARAPGTIAKAPEKRPIDRDAAVFGIRVLFSSLSLVAPTIDLSRLSRAFSALPPFPRVPGVLVRSL